MITGNESVNPFFRYNENGYGECIVLYSPDGSKQFLPYEKGITLRQELAARAMQGLCSNPDWVKTIKINDDWDDYVERLTEGAVEIADALIKALNK